MKKLILIFAMVLALLIPASAAHGGSYEPTDVDRALELMAPEVEVHSYDEWDDDSVSMNRDGRLVFVRLISTVVNGESGEGRCEDGSYIGYKPGQFETGTVIETWLLANPATDYCDDFIARWDEVVK